MNEYLLGDLMHFEGLFCVGELTTQKLINISTMQNIVGVWHNKKSKRTLKIPNLFEALKVLFLQKYFPIYIIIIAAVSFHSSLR